MRNYQLLFIITLVAAFFLTSCQKEQTAELAEMAQVSATNDNDNLIPTKEMNTNDPKLKMETSGLASDGKFATSQITTPKELKNIAASRSSFSYSSTILCGDNIMDSNKNKGNNIIGSVYKNKGCLNYDYGFHGEDVSYLLWVDAAGSYDISMSGMSKDLDIFLFSLDQNGALDQCLGYSINGASNNEFINAGLALGSYALIVDAVAPGSNSDFFLNITCAVVGNPSLCTGFDYYSNGTDIAANAYDWVKYVSYSGDATVTNAKSNNGGQSLLCDDDTDIVNLFGKEYNTGVHFLSWATFVPNGKSGAFIFEKYNQPGKEHSVRVFLESNGHIKIYAKGQTFYSTFTYNQNKWINIDVVYSLNSGQCSLSIDGHHVANFSATIQANSSSAGQKRLAGINFWGYESNSEFYIDDLCRTHANPFGETSSTTTQTLNIHPDN